MSGEKSDMRQAIDRVAVRIHEQNQKNGIPSTFESARKVARNRGLSYEARDPTNPARKGKSRGR